MRYDQRSGRFTVACVVRKADMDGADRWDAKDCPFARVVRRQVLARFRRWRDVEVEVGMGFAQVLAHVRPGHPRAEFVAKLPPLVRIAVASFDDHGPRERGEGLNGLQPDYYGEIDFEYNGYE